MKKSLEKAKKIGLVVLKQVGYVLLWIALLALTIAAMSAFIAGVTYIIVKYVNSNLDLWLYLAFVILTPIALFVAYIKTDCDWLNYALWIGGFLLIPASLLGCISANPDKWSMGDPAKGYSTDYSIPFHTAEDFHKLTGIEFPKVELVDSMAEEGGAFQGSFRNEEGKFLITDTKRNAKAFRRRLEEACKDEDSGWHVDRNDSTYHWTAVPTDEPNNNGDYNIDVPMKGDTITISTYWMRG